MRLLVEVRCPSNWKQDYADLVRDVLQANDIDVSSVEMIE